MTATQRKLTAIFAADVYQFSALMGVDEVGTLASLRACREIIDGLVAEHGGRVFGSAGDSVLAEFASVVSAVLCAVECQRTIGERNALPGPRPLQFRIGVNLGDVIVEGDNLYGDGVNVAARLESIAKPGSICVSAKVHDEVRRKLSDVRFIAGGTQKLRNIEDPVAIYHIGPTPIEAEVPIEAKAPAAPPSALPERPVIAVQAIRVISGDVEGGRRRLQEAMAASPEDASHLRHRRELALAQLLAGDVPEAVRTATKMVEDAPDMKRNVLVLAGLLAAAGNLGEARRRVAEVEATTPGLTLDNARLPYFGDGAAGVRFRSLLREAGL